MASRVDRIQKLAAGLAAAMPQAAPAQDAAPRPRGRPRADTVALNLRMPVALRDRAAVEAGRRSQEERRNVTPQAVILELLEGHLPPLPAKRG